ncbi:MAG: BamA/TamA family outer membrane protein [Bryobacterales bacterium]|nr:BamA/TamA family outer membrane protein [Bryobacterales bacterium]
METSLNCRLLFISVLAASALAQTATTEPATRAEEVERQRYLLHQTPFDPDSDPIERGLKWANDRHLLTIFSEGWNGLTPTIGGMINQSGFAAGIQFLRPDLMQGRLLLRTSARVSTRAYQMADFEIGLPRLAHDKSFFDLYVRHRNYGAVSYFGPGPHSKHTGGTSYRLEDTTTDFWTGVKLHQRMRLGVTGGALLMNVGPPDAARYPEIQNVYTPRQVPGLDRQSNYLRGGAIAHLDLRDSPYYPRSGGQYYARFDYYDDRTWGQYDFRRLTAEAQQFIPMFNKKRVIAARARGVFSYPNPRQQVPFYLQPSLGAADDLRGFVPFRFYDNNAMVANVEWRWEILNGVEGALFGDAGKVFPRPGLMNLRNIQYSFGGGLRFRAPVTGAMVVRLDAAFSREGFQVWFVFNDIFAAPQIRTGRELSPPPGRLP